VTAVEAVVAVVLLQLLHTAPICIRRFRRCVNSAMTIYYPIRQVVDL